MESFRFGTFDTAYEGLIVGGQNTFNFARRDRSFIAVQGRNGDLILDNGRYVNSTVSYKVLIPDDFENKRNALIRGLTTQGSGYVKLTDTYHPQKFRMATLDTDVEFLTGMLNRYGTGDVVFDCMPQLFLDAGAAEITIPAHGVVAKFEILGSQVALPLIKLYTTTDPVTANLLIGDFRLVITSAAPIPQNSVVYIDCEAQVVRTESAILTSGITVEGDFPRLDPQKSDFCVIQNTAAMTGVDRIGFLGRWWDL